MAFHFIRYASITMAISIDFTWEKDASGYRLVKKGSLSDGNPPEDRILPNGGKPVSIRPLDNPTLYSFFAGRDSAEKLLEFVERYGLLRHYEGEEYEYDGSYEDPIDGSQLDYVASHEGVSVAGYLRQSAAFREALERKAAGSEQLAAFLGSGIAPGEILGSLRLAPDRNSGARFQIRPRDLMQALWFQLGEALASDIKLSTCLQCGELFERGPGSGRRKDAKFCSDEHRRLYHSLNRKPARRS